MFYYHVVTDRPMKVGQHIVFDKKHHSGVHQRVYEKKDVVDDIYNNPVAYEHTQLEHHTVVALRELALEKVRLEKYPSYPSRMSCLYVSETFEEAERWGEFFTKIGRPTYSIVKLQVEGNYFIGDATKCFDGTIYEQENLKLAEIYWANPQANHGKNGVCEILVDGDIFVVEIVKEINENIDE